ncbi:hypothetical protein SOVF_052650 [Spinacia oleracea]|nr:hypothetical protein SOVF_052650 [Spinacia oleracea]
MSRSNCISWSSSLVAATRWAFVMLDVLSSGRGVIFTHLPWNHVSQMSQQIQNSSDA